MEQPYLGAYSYKQCQPCAEGFYSDQEGTAFCLKCAYSQVCSVGSTQPINIHLQGSSYSDQPQTFQGHADKVSEFNFYIGMAIIIVVVVMTVFIVSKKKIYNNLTKLDMYEANHNYETGQYMKLMKTPIGGLFSAIFLVLAIALVLSNLLSYFVDNVAETKALIPFLVMSESYPVITGDITILLKIVSYQGNCQLDEQSEDFSECNEKIGFAAQGFEKHATKNKIGNLQCKKIEKNCFARLVCTQCQIKEKPSIFFNLQEENSYASAIEFNITSTSSIPDELSSINITISADQSKIFRGPDPTLLEVTAIPSVFETNNPKQEEYDGSTGYHLMSSGFYQKGTMFTSSEVQFSTNLHAQIDFVLNENSLFTKQYMKLSPVILISAILGSVFGIMGSVGGAMSFVEKKKLSADNKILDEENQSKWLFLKGQFNYFDKNEYGQKSIQDEKKFKKFSLSKFLKLQQAKSKGQILDTPISLEDVYVNTSEFVSPFEQHLRDLKNQANTNYEDNPAKEQENQKEGIQENENNQKQNKNGETGNSTPLDQNQAVKV